MRVTPDEKEEQKIPSYLLTIKTKDLLMTLELTRWMHNIHLVYTSIFPARERPRPFRVRRQVQNGRVRPASLRPRCITWRRLAHWILLPSALLQMRINTTRGARFGLCPMTSTMQGRAGYRRTVTRGKGRRRCLHFWSRGSIGFE